MSDILVIKAIRERIGMTAEYLANELGMTLQNLSDIESGQRNKRVNKLKTKIERSERTFLRFSNYYLTQGIEIFPEDFTTTIKSAEDLDLESRWLSTEKNTEMLKQNQLTRAEFKALKEIYDPYAQNLYRQIIKVKRKEVLEMSLDEFYETVGSSKSYSVAHTITRVIEPAIKELVPAHLAALSVERIKGGYRNNQIIGLRFEFKLKGKK